MGVTIPFSTPLAVKPFIGMKAKTKQKVLRFEIFKALHFTY